MGKKLEEEWIDPANQQLVAKGFYNHGSPLKIKGC